MLNVNFRHRQVNTSTPPLWLQKCNSGWPDSVVCYNCLRPLTWRAKTQQKVINLKKDKHALCSEAAIQQNIANLQSANPRMRSLAAQELGKCQAETAVEALISTLREDVNTYVRSACAESLGQVGASEAIFPLMDALHDPCSFVRRAAVISLGQMGAKEAQGVLLQSLNDPNFYVRRAAINAIGKLGVPDMGKFLLPLLETADARILRTTITALQRLDYCEAIPNLVDLLSEYVTEPHRRDLPVVKTLVVALGVLRAQEAVPTLIKVLRGYVGVRSMAATALGKIGDPQAGPALMEALKDHSVGLRFAALRSLGKLQYRPATPTLRKFLASPDMRLRRVAVLAVGDAEDREAIPQLIKMAYDDPAPLVRPVAVEALGMIGNAEVLPDLLPLTNDPNAYLRAALVHTFGALDGKTPEVQAALRQLANDPVEHVATAAQRMLYQLAKPKAEVIEEGTLPVDAAITEPQHNGSWLKRFLRRG